MHLFTGTEVLTAALYGTARMSTDHNKQLLLHCRVCAGKLGRVSYIYLYLFSLREEQVPSISWLWDCYAKR